MKFFKTCILCALLSLLAAFQASAQSIVGAWANGDSTKEGSAVIVFFASGYYYQIQNAFAADAPTGFDGFERGTYTWNPATGAFTVTTLQDRNGDNGLSGVNSISGITITIAGANDSGVVVFLPNGVYFEAEDGDSTQATGDPSGHDGIEHGTYTWNPTTGIVTSSRAPAPYIDTNGEWGLSHTGANLTAHVSADGLTLAVSTGPSETFSLARVGAASTPSAAKPDLNQHGLTGSWYEPATGGQGVEVEVFANPSSGTGSTFVSWFTYDTVIGGPERQRWHTAQGPVVTGQPNAALTIYRNTGGNFNAPPVTTAQAVGTATLSFDTCTSGQLAYAPRAFDAGQLAH